MKRESSRVESGTDRAPSSRPDISRRAMLKKAATALGGGAGTLVGGAALAAAPGQSPVAVPARTPSQSGLVFRGYVRFGNGASVQELKLLPITPREVVVRTEAAQVCYTTTAVGLGTTPVTQADDSGSRRRRHRHRSGFVRRSRSGRRPRDCCRPGAMRLLLQLSSRPRRSLSDGRRRRPGERALRRDARRHEGDRLQGRPRRDHGHERRLLRAARHQRLVRRARDASRRRDGWPRRDHDQGADRSRDPTP